MLLNKNEILQTEFIFPLLNKLEDIISHSFNMPFSHKLKLNEIFGNCYKKKFYDEFRKIETKYVSKYTVEKNKKFKRLAEHIPYRDHARNKFIEQVPNFSQNLKENLLPLLVHSKEYLKKALNIIKNECLFYENGLKVEDILISIAEVSILLREYRPRIE